MTTKPTSALFPQRGRRTVRNVVLVHGAYADGSSWSDVIERLQRAGLIATAVQNPLTSLADDVAHTERIIALQDGPTILVGHSFAGTVITQTGIDPRVVGRASSRLIASRRNADFDATSRTGGTRRRDRSVTRCAFQSATVASCASAWALREPGSAW
jgi:pimeloyl-ACP methyl ester carboxylesterase